MGPAPCDIRRIFFVHAALSGAASAREFAPPAATGKQDHGATVNGQADNAKDAERRYISNSAEHVAILRHRAGREIERRRQGEAAEAEPDHGGAQAIVERNE